MEQNVDTPSEAEIEEMAAKPEMPPDRGRRFTAPARRVMVGSRRTSFRLEDIMWRALADIATETDLTIGQVIEQIDQQRSDRNLSSAVRCYIVSFYRAKAVVLARENLRLKKNSGMKVGHAETI